MDPREALAAAARAGDAQEAARLCAAMGAAWGCARRSGAWTLDVAALARSPAGLTPWLPKALCALDCAAALGGPAQVAQVLKASSVDEASAASALSVALSLGKFDVVSTLIEWPGLARLAFSDAARAHGVDPLDFALSDRVLAAAGSGRAVRALIKRAGVQALDAIEAEAQLWKNKPLRQRWAARLLRERCFGGPRQPLLVAWGQKVELEGGWEAALLTMRAARELGASWRMERAAFDSFNVSRGPFFGAWGEQAKQRGWGALACCAAAEVVGGSPPRWRVWARERSEKSLPMLPDDLRGVDQARAALERWRLGQEAPAGAPSAARLRM